MSLNSNYFCIFSTSVLLTFWAKRFYLGAGVIFCKVGCLTASMASHAPQARQPKMSTDFAKCPPGAESSLDGNH